MRDWLVEEERGTEAHGALNEKKTFTSRAISTHDR